MTKYRTIWSVVSCVLISWTLAATGQHAFFTPHLPLQDFGEARLFLKNHSVKSPIDVAILFVNDRASRFKLPSVSLGPRQAMGLDLKALLEDQLPPRAKRGNGRLVFEYAALSNGLLGAEVQFLDAGDRISLTAPAINNRAEFQNRVVYATAFLPTPSASAVVHFVNLSSSPRAIHFESFAKGHMHSRQLILGAGETQSVNVHPMFGPGAVGLKMSHDGLPGDILASGLAVERRLGFSKRISFRDPAWSQGNKLFAGQVVIDEPPAEFLLPDLPFETRLILFSSAPEPQTVDLRLLSEEGETRLPEIELSPLQPEVLSLTQLRRAGLLPEKPGYGLLIGSHSGPRGSVFGEVLCMDSGHDYLLSSPVTAVEGFLLLSKEWKIFDDFNTVLSVANVGPTTSQIRLSVMNGGREYGYDFLLDAEEQRTFSFRRLIREGLLEADDGDPLPADVVSGAFRVRNDRITDGLVMHSQVVNGALGTCEEVEEEEAYYLETEHRLVQPENSFEGFAVETWGIMNTEEENNVTGGTTKSTDPTDFRWFDSTGGLLPPFDQTGTLDVDLTDSIQLVSCGSGSTNIFIAFTFQLRLECTQFTAPSDVFGNRGKSKVFRGHYEYHRCPGSTMQAPCPVFLFENDVPGLKGLHGLFCTSGPFAICLGILAGVLETNPCP